MRQDSIDHKGDDHLLNAHLCSSGVCSQSKRRENVKKEYKQYPDISPVPAL
jgi:hypothetical protein